MAGVAPLKYLSRADKPIVYSVGSNGTDEGGSETLTNKAARRSKWFMEDAVTHLTRQPRIMPPAEETETSNEPLSGVDAESMNLTTRPATARAATTSPK